MNKIFSGLKSVIAAALMITLLSGCEDNGGIGDGHDFGANDSNLYVALGDSITVGNSGTSYPAELSALLGKSVINAGSDGSESGDGALRVGSILNNSHPGYLLILYGVNDVIMGEYIEDIIGNLRLIIQSAKANKTIPVIATYPSVFGVHIMFFGGVSALNSAIRSLASSENITLVDLESAFGNPNTQYMDGDGLHPNAEGYKLMARTFADVL